MLSLELEASGSLSVLHARAAKVWDTVTTTSEKYEGQSVYDPPSCIFSNVHAAYPVVTQPTLSQNEKLKGSASKFKGNSRAEENKSPAECDVKCCRSSAFSYILGGGGDRGTGGPTALPYTPALPTHTPWAEAQLWAPTSWSQSSVDGMTGQFNSLKLQKTNLAKKKKKKERRGRSIFCEVSRVIQLTV